MCQSEDDCDDDDDDGDYEDDCGVIGEIYDGAVDEHVGNSQDDEDVDANDDGSDNIDDDDGENDNYVRGFDYHED